MKTFLIIFSLLVGTNWVSAQAVKSEAKGPTRREITPEMRERILARTGGTVTSLPEGPKVLLLNTQRRVSEEQLRALSAEVQRFVQLPTTYKNVETAEPLSSALEELKDRSTAAVIVVGDSGGYPTLLLAPESGWALVNVAALAEDGAPADKIAERTQKEVWRAYGYLMGAANSNFEHCLMKSVSSVADLDALSGKCISPEPFSFIFDHARKLGMTQIRTATYRMAVQQGWAPTPTNEYQRAILEEFKNKPPQEKAPTPVRPTKVRSNKGKPNQE